MAEELIPGLPVLKSRFTSGTPPNRNTRLAHREMEDTHDTIFDIPGSRRDHAALRIDHGDSKRGRHPGD